MEAVRMPPDVHQCVLASACEVTDLITLMFLAEEDVLSVVADQYGFVDTSRIHLCH